MAKTNKPDASALLADLTDEERSRLPSRLRALDRDELTTAWNEAKAERDAAIAAASEEVREERTDPDGNAYVHVSTVIIDPEAVAAARARWAERRDELVAAGAGATED